jgi:hypothetical protein
MLMKNGSHDPEARDLLLTAAPAPDARAHENWADVLERASMQSRTRRLWRRPRVLAAVVAGALLLATGAAVAAIQGVPWWEDAAPPVNPEVVDWQLAPPADGSDFPPAADRSRARTVVEADGAALVAAPVGKGGYCVIPSLPRTPDLGFSCLYQPGDELRSYARPPSELAPRWIIYGRIIDPDAAALDLSEAAGVPFEVPLQRGGFFLANVPESRWSELSGRAGKGKIVDESGETLRTGCVNWGPSPEGEGAGVSRYPLWSEGDGPCTPRPVPMRPKIDLDRAQKLVSFTLTSDASIWKRGTTVALWHAPTLDGRECVYVAPAAPRPSGVSSHMPGGGICGPPARQRSRSPSPFGPIQMSVSDPGGLISGEVEPGSGIVRVELRSARGAIELPFSNGYFLGQLREGGSPGKEPAGGPYAVVGYDAAGAQVASVELQEFMTRARPPRPGG